MTTYLSQTTGSASTPGPSRPTVLVVEPHRLLADGIALALSGAGFDVKIAMPDVERGRLDDFAWTARVMIIDVELGERKDATRLVRLLSKAGAVVALARMDDWPARARCVEAGAVALADKERPLSDLLDIVHRVVAGETLIRPRERERLLELGRLHAADLQARQAPFMALTTREQYVLARLLEGHPASSIAAESSVSVSTVRSQIRSIFHKLGVHSQLRAVSMARQAEWTGGRPL